MIIVVFDTNLWIAAAIGSIYTKSLIDLAVKRKITIAVSAQIIAEVKEKLRKKFNQPAVKINNFIFFIREVTVEITPRQTISVIKNDPDDNKIIECAIAANASLVVSSDKHLLRLKKYHNIAIVHPRTMGWIFPKEL